MEHHFSNYPYVNFQDLNLDGIYKLLSSMDERLTAYVKQSTISFHDPITWDITDQYTVNTMVVDKEGTAYLSTRPVPVGIDIRNNEYWQPIFNYDDNINKVRSTIAWNERNKTTASKSLAKGELVYVDGVLYKTLDDLPIGTAFNEGDNIVKYTVYDRIVDVENIITAQYKELDTKIDTTASGLSQRITDNHNDINSEIVEREAELTRIDGEIEAEKALRENADNELRSSLNAEIQNRINEDNEIRNLIGSGTGYANVKGYGAIGDGVIDDTNAIQTAVNSDYSVIYFPEGIYKTGSIKIPSNKTLVGTNDSWLLATDNNILINNSNGLIGMVNANTNITINNLGFDANNSKCTSIAFGHSKYSKVINCRFKNNSEWHCIEFNASNYNYVINCVFYNYGGSSSTEMIQFDGAYNTSVFPWFGPYDNTGCRYNYIYGCTFNFEDKSNVEVATNPSKYIAIGNHTQGGLYNESMRESIISHSVFINAGWAIRVVSCVGLLVEGCKISAVSVFQCQNTTDRINYITFIANYCYGVYMNNAPLNAENYRAFNNSFGERSKNGFFFILNNFIKSFMGHGICLTCDDVYITSNVALESTGQDQVAIYSGYSGTQYINGNTCDVLSVNGGANKITIMNNIITNRLWIRSNTPSAYIIGNYFNSVDGSGSSLHMAFNVANNTKLEDINL